MQLLLPGGTESHVLTLGKLLVETGHQVGLFTAGGPWQSRFSAAGIRVHVYPRYRSGATRDSVAAFQRVVAGHQYQVVHAHDNAGFRLLARSAVAARKVLTVHGTYALCGDVQAAANGAHSVIAVSPVIQWYLVHSCRVPADRVRVIANGVSMGTFRPGQDHSMRQALGIPMEDTVIGYAGRFTLTKTKVSIRVCRSLAAYATRHRHVHVLIAGRKSQEALGAQLGPRVHVLGTVANMPKFYRNCDVVVGTARVALEAMAAQVPTLALGEARYLGPMTEQNLMEAWKSNYGDHGHAHGWSTRHLWTDLTALLHHPRTARRHARLVRQLVARNFSNRRMVLRTHSTYQ